MFNASLFMVAVFSCCHPVLAQVLGFDEKGHVLLDSVPVEEARLEEKLREAGPKEQGLSIEERADVPFYRLAQVLEIAQRAGWKKFSRVTALPKEENQNPVATPPPPLPSSPEEETRQVVFKVDAAGKLSQNGESLTEKDLGIVLQQLAEPGKPRCVVLLATRKVDAARLEALVARFTQTHVKVVTTVYIDADKFEE